MAKISNDELIRMLRRYAKWLKEKSDNSFQKNENLWKLILLAAERLYQYEQYQEETDAYKQGEWDMFELITSVEYGKQRFCDDFCGTVYDRSKCDHCGKQLDDHTDYIEVEIEIKKFRCADLCSDCMEELDRIVERFLNPDSQEWE